MSREPWYGADRSNAATSPMLLETLEQVRSSIADIAQSRERVQEQMNELAEQLAKRERQASEARRVGREDLVQAAHSNAEAMQRLMSDLAAQANLLKTKEQQVIRMAQQLQARIDSPSGAWRVDAETIMCALLPHVRRTWPTASNTGWWAIQPPMGEMTSVRAEALGLAT